MTLDQEYAKYAGQSVLVPGAAADDRGQCVQWADYVLHDVYGQPYVWADAINWWNQFDSIPQLKNNFVKVADGTIKKGDFVLWNQKVGSVYGHIDVAMTDGNINNFVAADTNWAGNLTVHEVSHIGQAGYIIGVLRHKGNQETPMATDSLSKADIQVIYGLAMDVAPEKTPDSWVKAYTGKPLDGFLTNLKRTAGYQQHFTQVNAPAVAAGFKPYTGPQLYVKD